MKLILQPGGAELRAERERASARVSERESGIQFIGKKDEREYEMKWKWGKTRAALGIKKETELCSIIKSYDCKIF